MWYANSAKSNHIAALIVNQNTKGRGGNRRPFPPRRNSTAFDCADYARFRGRQTLPYEPPHRREQRTYNDRDREPSDNRSNYVPPSSSRAPLADRSNERPTQRQMSPPTNNNHSHASSSSASVDRSRASSTRMDNTQWTPTPLNRYTIHILFIFRYFLFKFYRCFHSHKIPDRRSEANANNTARRHEVEHKANENFNQRKDERKSVKTIDPKIFAGDLNAFGQPKFILSASKEVKINGIKCIAREQLYTFDFIGDDFMLSYILFHTKTFGKYLSYMVNEVKIIHGTYFFRADSTIKHWSLCKKGQTIADTIHIIKQLPRHHERRVLINIGVTDITQNHSFTEMTHQYKELVNLCIERKMKPIVTTLVPYDGADMKTMKRLYNFNIHLKKNYKNVVDFYSARSMGLFNALCSLLMKR